MTKLIQLPLDIGEQRVVLSNLSWQQYETLLSTFQDQAGLRLSYLEGDLEIFMPSLKHEAIKKVIARLLERYSEEVDIPIHGFGSAAYRSEAKARGIEPDECYCVQTQKEIPDLALEVNLTSGGIDKLDIYKGLGVREVWVWQNQQITIYDLRPEIIQVINHSQFFPNLDIQLLAQYVRPYNQPQAVKEFIAAIRSVN